MNEKTPLQFVLFTVIVFWTIVIGIVLLSSLPFNPLTLPFNANMPISTLLPQGWAFFTRDPQEERFLVYHRIQDKWILQSLPNSHHTLGADRSMRVLTAEVHYIVSTLKDSVWSECNKTTFECLPEKSLDIANKYHAPLLCGEIIIQKQKPVPWAWSKSALIMPSHLVRLNVICEE